MSRYLGVATRVATMTLGSSSDAEDVVQDAAMSAYRAIGGFRHEAPFRPWFLRIVTNAAHNRRRSLRRHEALRLRVVHQADVAVAGPDDVAVERADQQRVLAALAAMAPDDRLVIALRHIEGLSESETAAALDCAVGTVKSRLSRAMTRLRTSLATDLEADISDKEARHG